MIKFKIFLILVLLIIVALASIISCTNEPFDLFPDNIQKIDTESALFNSLKSISQNENDDVEPICVTFIYPFNIYLFNDNSEIEDSQIVNNNLEFVELLGNVENNTGGIGLSYPITTILADGSTFSIQDNAELKETIEKCIESEIINYCNRVLEEKNCVWKITSLTENSRYDSSLLDFYEDGTGIFYDNGNAYRTSWISLILEEELHVNIHLEGDSEVSEDWNFDWKAVIIDEDTIELSNGDKKYRVKKECDVDNSCDYVEFRECELPDSEHTATFVFDNYKDCILSFRENTTSVLSLSFYKTQEQAEQEINRLDSSSYLNTTNPQLIFVTIKNEDTSESKIIRIVLFAEACNSPEEN